MSLDVNQPTDQVLVSEIPSYIRANRVEINSITDDVSDYTTTNLTLSAGTTTLVIGTSLNNISIETIFINSLGASVLAQIQNGTNGQIKIFVMQDSNISFLDGPKLIGQLYLNQLPLLSTFSAHQDDVIALINIGGDGGTNYGYWKEIFRQTSVK